MEFEVLKRSHLKRNILIGVAVIAIIAAVVLQFTRAKYIFTDKMPLINGTVNYSPGDIIITAYYNNEQLETFPTKDSGYTVDSIVCDNDASASFDENNWEITVTNFVTKGTKCDVTFVDKVSAKDYILSNAELGTGTPNFANTSCSSGCDEATVGLYTAEDNDGTTYYYRGDVDDNWVNFGGYYWRIIRINSNGSIRLIYAGVADSANPDSSNTTGEGTQIGTSAFNSSYDQSRYVGLVYGSTTDQHGYGNNSTIMTELNTWYTNNIQNTEGKYFEYIDTGAGFCSDRGPNNGWSNRNDIEFYHSPYTRIIEGNPSLKCSSEDILSKDNGRLDNPIGLITVDEASYAGIVWWEKGSTTNNYLYTGKIYWTMSPYAMAYYQARVFSVVNFLSNPDADALYFKYGIRPVINLKADTQLTGSGNSTDPFVVEGAE